MKTATATTAAVVVVAGVLALAAAATAGPCVGAPDQTELARALRRTVGATLARLLQPVEEDVDEDDEVARAMAELKKVLTEDATGLAKGAVVEDGEDVEDDVEDNEDDLGVWKVLEVVERGVYCDDEECDQKCKAKLGFNGGYCNHYRLCTCTKTPMVVPAWSRAGIFG